MDRRLLRVIIEDYDGGPVGVETLAAALGEPRDTIEDVYEPYLLQQGYLGRTPRGRVATRSAPTPTSGLARCLVSQSVFDERPVSASWWPVGRRHRKKKCSRS